MECEVVEARLETCQDVLFHGVILVVAVCGFGPILQGCGL